MGVTYAWLSLVVLQTTLCGVAWTRTSPGDLSLVPGGEGVLVGLRGGLPCGVWGPLLRSSWIALLVSRRCTWCSVNLLLRLSIAAVNLPDSAADRSDRILLCLLVSAAVLALNSCRDASCSLWNAANRVSTSLRMVAGEMRGLSPLLSPSLSLLLLSSLTLTLSVPLPLVFR